jgi:hypothetical protein
VAASRSYPHPTQLLIFMVVFMFNAKAKALVFIAPKIFLKKFLMGGLQAAVPYDNC